MATKLEFMLTFTITPKKIVCEATPEFKQAAATSIVKSVVESARDLVRQKLVVERGVRNGAVNVVVRIKEKVSGRDINLKLLNAQGVADVEAPSE
jgi:hypothetical protein